MNVALSTKSASTEQLNEEHPLIDSKKTVRNARLPQYIASLSACLGSLAAGAVTGWIGNISEDMKKFTYNGIEINDNILEWIGSLTLLGAAFSSIPCTFLCDLIGRKMTLLILTFPYVIGWLLIIFATGLWILYLGRFVVGVAAGVFYIVVPIYVCEIVDKGIRGALASCSIWFVAIGILLAYVSGSYMSMFWYTVFMGLLPVIFGCIFSFQPESPMYLIRKAEYTKAKINLVKLRGEFHDVEKELEDIKLSVARDKQNSATFLNSIKKKSSKRAIFICFTLLVFSQVGGTIVITTYTETIFQMAGVPMDIKLFTIITGVVQVIATLCSTIAVDRIGRRILLISSNYGTMISMGCLAIFFTLHDRNLVNIAILSNIGLAPLVLLSIYIVSFSFGMGPLPWVLTAELLPVEIKSLGGGFATALTFFIGFLMTNFYFDVQSALGSDITFYFFSVISLLTIIFVYYFVPETKNKTLGEIQTELDACVG